MNIKIITTTCYVIELKQTILQFQMHLRTYFSIRFVCTIELDFMIWNEHTYNQVIVKIIKIKVKKERKNVEKLKNKNVHLVYMFSMAVKDWNFLFTHFLIRVLYIMYYDGRKLHLTLLFIEGGVVMLNKWKMIEVSSY